MKHFYRVLRMVNVPGRKASWTGHGMWTESRADAEEQFAQAVEEWPGHAFRIVRLSPVKDSTQ